MARKRVDAMMEYMKIEAGCRTKYLVGYFDEPDPLPCGYCDHCLKTQPAGLSHRKIDQLEEYLQGHPNTTIGELQQELSYTEEELRVAINFLISEHHPLRLEGDTMLYGAGAVDECRPL